FDGTKLTATFASSTAFSTSNFFASSASTTNLTISSSPSGILQTNAQGLVSAGQVALASQVSGTLPAANGGTGTSTLAAYGNVLAWNGSTYQGFSTSSLAILLSDTTGTLAINRGGSNATSFTQGQLLAYDGTSFVSTSTIGNNQLANSSITVNGSTIPLGGSATISAASSTLLSNNNTWSGTNAFSNITFTNATTSTLYITGRTSALLATDQNG